MNPSLLDILACPADHAFPLECLPFRQDAAGEILDGALRCPRCATPYAVLEGVPHLVRHPLRDDGREQAALARHGTALPGEWRLGFEQAWREASAMRGESERRLLEEGRHWGDFFRMHAEADSTTIFDARIRGRHMPYLGFGITAADDRDLGRIFANYPNPLGRLFLKGYDAIERLGGAWILDLGCGAGQFGVEAAWRGARGVGADLAAEAPDWRSTMSAPKPMRCRFAPIPSAPS